MKTHTENEKRKVINIVCFNNNFLKENFCSKLIDNGPCGVH